jgi:hypothetical protein
MGQGSCNLRNRLQIIMHNVEHGENLLALLEEFDLMIEAIR